MNETAQYLLAQAAKQPLRAVRFATAELWRRGRMRWSNSIEHTLPAFSASGVEQRFAPFLGPRMNAAAEFTQRLPFALERIVERAEGVCRHEFAVLGERFTAPDAPAWHRDPKTGYEWPVVPPGELDILSASPGSDVKRPWDLGRFHHGLHLGQAFLLTGRSEFAREFAQQVAHWIAQCPYPRGIHWAMPMEVGIRVANWCLAGGLLARGGYQDAEFWSRFQQQIFLHGRFLQLHREWNPVARGNHYLGSVVGLLFAGALFRDTAEGAGWLQQGRAAVAAEMEEQVGADGVAHEGSSGYHLLVLEMMTAAALVATRALCPADPSAPAMASTWGEAFARKLASMYDFPAELASGRRTVPILGDADDGRLLPLCSCEAANSVTHILETGRALFPGNKWPSVDHMCEEAWWLTGAGCPPLQGERPAVSRGFAESGFYFLTSKRMRASVRCGRLGVNGWANHAHCDQLSVEFCVDGASVLMDPGTYVYASDGAARNAFRGSRAHNAPVVNSAEQNRFWPGLLFRIVDDTQSQTLGWRADLKATRLVGEHRGYERLPVMARVRREVILWQETESLEMIDSVTGRGSVDLEWNWQFAPELPLIEQPVVKTPPESGWWRVLAWQAGPTIMTVWAEKEHMPIEARLVEGWVAPRYGRRLCAPKLQFSCNGRLPMRVRFVFSLFGTSTGTQ
jgi:hypothetical protein